MVNRECLLTTIATLDSSSSRTREAIALSNRALGPFRLGSRGATIEILEENSSVERYTFIGQELDSRHLRRAALIE